MPTKMRLQRHGKKGRPFYHIVIADGRAPRDGKFIEKIGTYNPVARPAEIELDFAKAYDWFVKGADPTPTVKSILTHEGVLHYNHLMKGVAKGAFTKEIAEVRFNEWKASKESKLTSAERAAEQEERADLKKRLEAEGIVNEARAAEIAKKRLQEAKAAAGETEEVVTEEAAAEEVAVEEVAIEAPKAEVPTEEPAVEEPKAEVPTEAPTEEPKAEGPVEEPKAEVPAEVPAAEAPVEEPKAEAPTEEPAADAAEEKPAE